MTCARTGRRCSGARGVLCRRGGHCGGVGHGRAAAGGCGAHLCSVHAAVAAVAAHPRGCRTRPLLPHTPAAAACTRPPPPCRLTEAGEKAKIELSSLTQTSINLPFITATPEGPKHIDTQLTRAKWVRVCWLYWWAFMAEFCTSYARGPQAHWHAAGRPPACTAGAGGPRPLGDAPLSCSALHLCFRGGAATGKWLVALRPGAANAICAPPSLRALPSLRAPPCCVPAPPVCLCCPTC